MTLLKPETLLSVISAAIGAGLDCDDLLLGIPRDTQASLVKARARSAREQYLSVLSQLNDWRGRGREEPPLRTLLHNMQFLAGACPQTPVFEKALMELDAAPPNASAHGELLFTRAKDCYMERGYRVVPPVDAPVSLTFQAWRGTSAVSIVGVAAVAPLESVINAVRKLVEQLAPHERVEGCVVLSSNDPREVEQVACAGLIPLPHKELARMGVREITAFVDRQQAALAQEETQELAVDEDRALCRDVRAGLRESSVRIVLVRTPSVTDTARRIALSLTRDYLRDPARAAPLLLQLTTESRDFQELVSSAFNERRVPFSRFDFPGLLTENAFLPVFAVDSPLYLTGRDSVDDAVLQCLAKGAKMVLVTSEEVSLSVQQVASRCKIRPRNVRTLSALTPEAMPLAPANSREPSVASTKAAVISQFAQGRALLVGVANYPRASPLPENVLNDARDIASLLRSPTRCGYPEANVELLLDAQATAERFRLGLERLARDARPDDTVVVFFSGHGVRRGAGGDTEAYLLPFDYDPNQIQRTALSTNELSRLLAAIRSSRLVVLFDACHSAAVVTVKADNSETLFKSGLDDNTYEVLGRGAGRVVMASSRADEYSLALPGMKNSLFTAYLLEALEGDAVNRNDDVVRVLDVFHHISENVPLKGAQHPVLKAQDVENNFPIALNLKKKQQPLPPQPETKVRSTRLTREGSTLSPKARLAIKNGLIRRWDDLADYFAIPLTDKAKFDHGYEGQRTLEWLEERGRLGALREAFSYFGWDDLIADLDRHSQ